MTQQTSPVLQLLQASALPRLSPTNAECHRGELLHIIGPNGAGKSTLLARAAGLLAGEGDVYLVGTPMSQYTAADLAVRRAYLAQQQPPLALMPVFQYWQRHQPPLAQEDAVEKVVHFLAERLMLTDKLARPLTQLSGGEWQRVRLVAALLQIWPTINPHARLLLLDEPTNSLDVAQQVALDALLSELCRLGIAVVVCAHDLNHSAHHADRVWLLSAGTLVAQGETADVMLPDVLSPVFGVAFQRHVVDGRNWIITRSA
ncbi:vitamin B12 ABC transporter ATP-binding protein BtuD [Pectobacterium versatile]|uniref:Vitamin B12 import ATP-binding protein BtuD n=1 Tax=Pectobacterium versatile TaxID=2488639 RepID=A0A7V8PFY5_9GAMM|nr:MULTISPECIES: vitamin B12 ABC transporter ATP-binding protein BtuD [Pectobacterium]MBA0164609.1 vitamin B12 ABC transporter ATP-binding protein BtuD [Pectobacterium versatile]MBA0182816.1 vitamin B12 ABC transporter ATP-binding protein BtuD [Pectobacterium versatile]MBD0848000.1 vitamin B12 ABC transporter ATPase [Pectobacterium carotovorum subsp. carotovorum]MBK4826555.1 Vitamin B12-transporting ATPase [Pectobacterium carotovorum subsp. carotovorum]MBN3060628.1 vitamin B12 ABC transporter 